LAGKKLGGTMAAKKTAKKKGGAKPKTARKSAAKKGARKRAKPKPSPKGRGRAKPKKRASAWKSLRFRVTAGHGFYLYIALLPLLALWSLNSEKEMWEGYVSFISPEEHPAGHLAYHLFCAFVFFFSPVFCLFVIRNTPEPENPLAAWFLLLDVPVVFALGAHWAGGISTGRMFVGAFLVEVLAFVAAVVWLRVISWKTTVLLVLYALLLLGSFFGVETGRVLLDAGWKSGAVFAAAFAATLLGYYGLLRGGVPDARGATQMEMSNAATILMFATWCLSAVVLFAAVA